MGARRDYVINVLLEGDRAGIEPIERGLANIEQRVESLNGRDVGVGIHLEGNVLDELRQIESQLETLHGQDININVTGNFERQLENIETMLGGVLKEQDLKLQLDSRNAERGFAQVEEAVDNIIRSLGTINATNIQYLGEGLARGIEEGNTQLSKLSSGLSSLGSRNVGSDIGNNIARGIQGATTEVGKLQQSLNSLHAPQIDMGAYYGSYDQLGHLNMGAVGGSRILSMMGLGGFKNITWGNASTEQTNLVLSQRMDKEDMENGTGFYLSGKTFEGGTDTITHAVAQNRTVRNPDLIAQLYAFKMATGASNEQLMSNVFGKEADLEWGSGSGVDVIAAFGESVALQTGSEQLGTSAMFDLAKAFGGQYASVDQYGISPETLKRYGYDPSEDKDQKDIEGYLAAVGRIIGADTTNELMNTTEGGMTKVRKRFHRAGREIGQLMMGPVDFLSSLFLRIDTKDLNLFGFNIPKGTFTKALIGITGLVSAIGPFQETMNAVHQTFDKVTGAMKTAVNGVGNLTERIVALGNASKASEFRNLGASGILAREEYQKLHPGEVLESRLTKVQNKRGVHDFKDKDIDLSGMTWSQKRRTKAGRNLDSLIYDLEGGMSDSTHFFIERQAKQQAKDNKALNEWKKRASERKELSKMDRMGDDQYILSELLGDWERGRKNEISELSNWEKLKKGTKGSFRPQSTAFSKAMQTEMGKYEETSRWNILKKNTKGRFKGLKSGLGAAFKEGGLKKSFGSLFHVLTGVVSAINPVTIAFYGLLGVLGVIGGVLAYAWANFESFQNKIKEIQEKFGKLMDAIFYYVGDLLGMISGSGEGGMSGLETGVNRAANVIKDILDVLYYLVQAITGRDIEREKHTAPLEKDAKDTWKKIQEQEKERGGPLKADAKLYQKFGNDIDKLAMYDPYYKNENYLKELTATDDNKEGIFSDKYTGTEGKKYSNLGKYISADTVGRWEDDKVESQYNFFNEEKMAQLEDLGVDWTDEQKQKAYEYMANNPEGTKEFEKAIAETNLHKTSRWMGMDWNDTPFAKNSGAFDQDKNNNFTPGDSALGRIVDPIMDVLWWISRITAAILAVIIAEKTLGALEKLAGKWGSAKGDKWYQKAGNTIKDTIKEKFPHLSEKVGKGKDKVVDKVGGYFKKNKAKPKWDKMPEWMQDAHKDFKGAKNTNRINGIKEGIKSKTIESSIGKRIWPKEGILSSISEKVTTKLPNLTSKVGEPLKNALGKVAKWFGEKGIGQFLSKGIFGRIGGWLGGKLALGSIPVIGQIVDLLWLAWDLTSWIGDFLHSMGVPEWIIEMILPLRIIQNHWNDIVDAATGFGQWITNGLRSMGLDALADGLEWLWQKIVEIYNGLQNIPVIGWLIPGDPIEEDGGAKETSENTSATTESVNSTNALNDTISSSDGLNYNMATAGAFNSNYNSTNSSGYPYNMATASMQNNLQNSSTANTANNNSSVVINNNMDVTGVTDDEDLGRKIMNFINEHLFWDAQRAGRTVDDNQGGIMR